ncbi:MAG: cellulase family glycosylhydrolase, partial [Candidatus Margulisiibacteriota bacterium]
NEPVVRNPDGGGGDARAANLAQGGPAQTGNPELEVLKDAFRAVIKAVRENGDQHIIFLEGHQWAQRVEFLADMVSGGHAAHCGGNVALSVHFYEPTEFTFNTDPTLHYPGKVHGKLWDRAAIKQYLSQYAQYNVPVYVGEFGVSAGDTAAADTACPAADDKYRWVAEVVSVMCDLGYHWTYWTYKSVAGMPWPDGLYQISEYFTGMKNVGRQLAADKGRFYENLDTSRFKLNHRLLDLLQK